MSIQNFKFYSKQCPFAPSDLLTGKKRLFFNLVSAFLTIFVLFYRRINNYFDFQKYKYTLGIIVSAKNESEYIQEWCAFHKAAGVDIIYLYDNESFDDMKEKLRPFIDSGFVKYHYVEGKGRQMQTYKEAFNRHRKECKYLAIIDCDEYLFSVDTNRKLKESIKSFFLKNKYAGGLVVNWIMFGDNGHVRTPSGLCFESFTKRALPGKSGTIHVKSIMQTKDTLFINTPHSAIYKWGKAAYSQDGKIVPGPFNTINHYPTPIHLNHYFCKSIEQWHKRRNIGDVFTPDFIRPVSTFHTHNNNDVEDVSILAYLQETKQILKTIQNTETA